MSVCRMDDSPWCSPGECEHCDRARNPKRVNSFETITVYQCGHTDGYTHTHSGPIYRSFDAAQHAGKLRDGAYSVDPKPLVAIDCGDGTAYIVEATPIKFAETVELEEVARQAALKRLSPYERKLLNLKEPKK